MAQAFVEFGLEMSFLLFLPFLNPNFLDQGLHFLEESQIKHY